MSSPSTPETIGRFRVDAVIGAGGMGEVYKAFDPMLRRTVAIKMVRPGANNPQFLERLLHEAQACARLRHPSVVTVHEAGEIDGSIYMAMEFLTGENLAAVLRRHSLAFEDGIRILAQVLDALEHAHREGVIHRDIKPANIQVEPDGTIKLVDFGLARTAQTEPMTATGVVMGTPDYASPEQLRAEHLDHRTDIFSMGVVAYEVITGHRPWPRATDLSSLLYNIVHEPAPPMDGFWIREFPELEPIVMRALAKAPVDRYQSAAEMRDALRAFLAGARERIAIKEREANEVYEGRTGENASARVAPPPTFVSGSGSGIGAPSHQTDAAVTLAPGTVKPATAAAPASVPVAAPASAAAAVPMPGTETSVSKRGPATWIVGAVVAAVAILMAVLLWPSSSSEGTSAGTTGGAPAAAEPATPDPNSAAAQIAPAQLDAIQQTLTQAANAPNAAAGSANSTAASPNAASASSASATAGAAPTATAVRDAAGDSSAPGATSARLMFAGTPGATAAATRAGLRYRIIRQSIDRSLIADVDPATTTFKSGERVRLVFEGNINGYLYVVQLGTSGNWTVLFPHPEINGGRNAISKGEEYTIPNPGVGWFRIDDKPGTEQIYAFLSREPLSQLPGFKEPVKQQYPTLMASVVGDLQGRIRSRDLVFEKDSTPAAENGSLVRANYVVNRTELGQAVAAEIKLNHVD